MFRRQIHTMGDPFMSKRYSMLFLMALSIAASRSHAASVANLTCTGNQGSVTMNLSYFGIGATLTSPAASSNQVQNSLMPLDLHAALTIDRICARAQIAQPASVIRARIIHKR